MRQFIVDETTLRSCISILSNLDCKRDSNLRHGVIGWRDLEPLIQNLERAQPFEPEQKPKPEQSHMEEPSE